MASIFGNTIIQNLEEHSSLDNTVSKKIEDSYNIDLNAFYRAFVANNDDPLRLGRVQVRVPSIHGTTNSETKTPTEALPWASPGIWNCAGNDMGQYLVPEIGTVVFITFEQGDSSKPIYFGGISNQIGSTTKYIVNPMDINKGESYSVDTDDYPEGLESIHDKLLFKSAKGNEVVTSDLDGKEYMYLVDASGQSIEMENFGPYLKRRGTGLGYSGKPRMKLSTNRGSDMVLTNEAEIMTTRQLQGQLDNIRILNKTDDLNSINDQLDKLLRDKFKDFGNYSYNPEDKVFNLDLKLNDILDLTTTTKKVYDYEIKIFNEFELLPGLFLQVSLLSKEDFCTRALMHYRNTMPDTMVLDGAFIIYFANLGKIEPYVVTSYTEEDEIEIASSSEGDFYVNIWGLDLYDYSETWGFDYRKEFRFIVDTTVIPDNDIFSLDFTGVDSSTWVGYISSIDWGDGETSEYTEIQNTYSHDYKKAGSYRLILKTEADDFEMPYEGLKSKGVVSIESPIPICANSNGPKLWSFGASLDTIVTNIPNSFNTIVEFRNMSTLVHINRFLFRNYLLRSDSIDLSSVFKDCWSLEFIPVGLLEGFNSISSLQEAFRNCDSLKGIPEDLLEDKDLSECLDLSYMFYHCSSLEMIPDFLFDNKTLLSVERTNNMFSYSAILKIPKVLLKHMENLEEAISMFSFCEGLTYIPDDLFKYNKELTSAKSVFVHCSNLLDIPRFIFRYNQKLRDLESCFAGCTSITKIYSDMFSNLGSLESLKRAFGDSGVREIIRVNERLLSGIRTSSNSLNIESMFVECKYLKINEKDLLSYGIDNILPDLYHFFNQF